MRAWVVRAPGAPEVLRLEARPEPVPRPGEVLIEIAAFGLNRAEAVTRAGGSGDAVRFPRVLGLECVGTVREAPGTPFEAGQPVAAVMGGLGRDRDGSYAERTVAPATGVIGLDTALAWPRLAALPESFLTAWGCLHEGLRIAQVARPRVVVRPGASALGRAITQIVNARGGRVIGITRSPDKVERLLAGGMHDVVVGTGAVAGEIRRRWPDGATGIVDTVTSAVTIADDLAMRARGGRLCIAGSLAASTPGERGAGARAALALARPSVTRYSSESITAATHADALRAIVRLVEAGVYDDGLDAVLPFTALVDAHRTIDTNGFAGKAVVEVSAGAPPARAPGASPHRPPGTHRPR